MENRADSHQGLHVQVTSRRNSSTGLQVRLWTTAAAHTITAASPPVLIYAQVCVGTAPVRDARVVAKLQRLGTNATGNIYQPLLLELWDNGAGGQSISQSGFDYHYFYHFPLLELGLGTLYATPKHYTVCQTYI